MNFNLDLLYMHEAIKEAFNAYRMDEIPVGAVVVDASGIVSRGFNTRETEKNPLGHAEINAIKEASKLKKSKRLNDCTLYVTLEPCPMCAGAILESAFKRLVFGAYDPKMGASGSVMDITDYPGICKRVLVKRGVMEKECSFLLNSFFKKLRRRDG